MSMTIRNANESDLDRIMEIYARAQVFMRENGNPTQWSNIYPKREVVEEDVKKQISFVCTDEVGKVQGVFVFIIGKDPTYAVIRDGAWKDEREYGTIHRIASSGERHGVFDAAIDFCQSRINNLRIDTHRNNLVMQHLVSRRGFAYCGIIYAEDGTERFAYQYSE